MGKVNCPCGWQISDVGVPSHEVGYAVSDHELDEMAATVQSLEIMDSRKLWECSKCGRVAFDYPEAGSNRVKWYVPDDGKPGTLMSPPDQEPVE
jgi:hypothetical protein